MRRGCWKGTRKIAPLALLGCVLLEPCLTSLAAQELGEQRVATSMLTFLKIGVGARAVAMGGAFTPVADDATALHWNPAGLALLEERHLHVSHTEWPADIDYESVFLTLPVASLGGGLGFMVSSLRTELDFTTEEEPLPHGRTFGFSDLLIGAGYARQFTDRFSFGFNVKYVREDLGSEVGGSVLSSWAADVGTMFQLPYRGFRMSMAWTNMGPDFQPPGGFLSAPTGSDAREVRYQSFSPASIFSFGASLEPVRQPHFRMVTSLQFDHPADTEELLKGGVELWIDEIIALRTGWNPRSDEMQFSAGFGLRGRLGGRSLSIDYAYTDGNALGRIDRLSLEMEF
ncbi:MAG: PorV/PorQ family protein [Candidatus Krumholzibacteriia bacterium]